MLKLSVIGSNEQTVGELDHILGGRNGVTIQHAFAGNPGRRELDRHLHFHSPNAVLISSENEPYALALVDYITGKYPHLPVVILQPEGYRAPESLLQFMRAGVRDWISQPLDPEEIAEVIDRLCAMPAKDAAQKLGKVLCFLPSKPGVGSSTVAVNTASALAQEGSRVLLVDGDLTSGMVRFMLKLKNTASILDAAQRVAELDGALWPQMITEVGEGLDVLHAGKVSSAGSLDSGSLLSLIDFWRTAYDFVCIDFSGNLERFCLDAMRFADRIFLVSTSEVNSLHLLIEKAQVLKANDLLPRVQVIQNRKGPNEDLNKGQIESLTRIPICKVFRNSYSETLAASKEGRTVRAKSALGSQFRVFAAELSGRPARSGSSLLDMFAAIARKAWVSETRQIAGTVPSDTRALPAPRIPLALPQATSGVLVRRYGADLRLAAPREDQGGGKRGHDHGPDLAFCDTRDFPAEGVPALR